MSEWIPEGSEDAVAEERVRPGVVHDPRAALVLGGVTYVSSSGVVAKVLADQGWIAARGERFDKALFTATARATGAMGNSNALVGTPETVAEAMLDYVDLGVDILSARGYDTLQDTIDFGREVIPIIREEVAKRDREKAAAAAHP